MTDPVFFAAARQMTIGEVAALSGARLVINGAEESKILTGVSAAQNAASCDLAFVEGRKNRQLLDGIGAGAVFVSADLCAFVPAGVAILEIQRPSHSFAAIARMLFPTAARPVPVTGETGLSAFAHIHPQSRLEDGVIVEAGAVIGAGAGIGSGTIIAPNAVIGENCQIGRDCYVGAGATITATMAGNRVVIMAGARIGQDGFGFVPGASGLEKVPQIGRVILQDDVEIGANSTVDRGALDDTVVGEGTKIDNLVQIAHNVKIGRCCAIAAHCGISGSSVLGNFVMLGGRVGISDHVTIGDGVQIAAGSGLMHDIPAGEKWGGAPAMPIKQFFRQISVLRKLSEAPRKRDDSDG